MKKEYFQSVNYSLDIYKEGVIVNRTKKKGIGNPDKLSMLDENIFGRVPEKLLSDKSLPKIGKL